MLILTSKLMLSLSSILVHPRHNSYIFVPCLHEHIYFTNSQKEKDGGMGRKGNVREEEKTKEKKKKADLEGAPQIQKNRLKKGATLSLDNWEELEKEREVYS